MLLKKAEKLLKNGKTIRVSTINDLDQAMVSTGFACLRENVEDNNLQRFCRVALLTMGQRRLGSAAIDLCNVADGQVDAFWEQNLKLYDVAAGSIILEVAGGEISDFKGNRGIFPREVLATNGKIHQLLLNQM